MFYLNAISCAVFLVAGTILLFTSCFSKLGKTPREVLAIVGICALTFGAVWFYFAFGPTIVDEVVALKNAGQGELVIVGLAALALLAIAVPVLIYYWRQVLALVVLCGALALVVGLPALVVRFITQLSWQGCIFLGLAAPFALWAVLGTRLFVEMIDRLFSLFDCRPGGERPPS